MARPFARRADKTPRPPRVTHAGAETMFFSPFTNVGLEGALHKSLLKLLFLPVKGHSGMGGKGRGWGQDGSNRP